MPQLGMPRGKSVIQESLFIIFVALCKKLFDFSRDWAVEFFYITAW